MCAACERREKYEPSEWFCHISYLSHLLQAGYPFTADDLSLEEWLDIGNLRREEEAMRLQTEHDEMKRRGRQ